MSEPILPTNQCKQCGLSHPPLPEGARCPMVKHSTIDGKNIDYGIYIYIN